MKSYSLLVIILIPITFFGQQVDLTVQTGHSASINTVIFSPNDELIASAGDDNKIVIWDSFGTVAA